MGISPEQWERVKDIYEAALQCSTTQRATFVERETKDDLVRSEVLRLLSETDSVGSFLSTPPFVDPRLTQMAPPERLEEGQVLAGRFRIVGFIAAGGMGEVYKAQDKRLDRLVVLKFLPKELTEDQFSLDRFRREAKAASALNHPNICTVYDFGEDAGRAFIAMEYLDGETLSARIKRGPLSVKDAVKVAIEISGALSAAHRKGIIHRDLKPGNIMLTDMGAKLLDFGLAKHERPAPAFDVVEHSFTGEAAGTPPYMSPEQLQGKEVDARTDIFAFGAVLYEMLTGRRAFQRHSRRGVVVVDDGEEPKSLRELFKDVPDEIERIVLRCLRKNSTERYNSVVEIEQELSRCATLLAEPSSGINQRLLFRRARRPAVAVPLLLTLLGLAGLTAWRVHFNSRMNWARTEALPRIAQLSEQNKNAEAYALAVQAERYIPHDPLLVKYWDQISWSDTIATSPPGASVYRKNYNAPENAWEYVGQSPIEKGRFPLVDSRWKFEKKGYATVERTTTKDRPTLTLGSPTVTMVEEQSAPGEMVRVELATPKSQSRPVHLYGLAGHDTLPPVPLTDFWIDKFEVTNAEYEKFVNQGGYQKQEYWKEKFEKDGKALSWAQAMKLFVDETGSPGPATWIQGGYPRGQDNYPVTGVSWFEAAAYAEFAGKSLPTIYHWRVAALPTDSANIVPASNFGRSGPAPVGTYHGVSWSGAYDMAGNVKEWIWNEAVSGERFTLGGAWNEPIYAFNMADPRSPFERSANLGFRCAKYVLTGESAKAADPVTHQVRNYSLEKPVSDEGFKVYQSLYSYDKTPLRAVVESSQQKQDWKLEKITFDAAYGRERVAAYLYLPRNVKPPFQTVVYFPGAAALLERSSENDPQLEAFDFIIKSGRAVIFPVYKGTFERFNDYFSQSKTSSYYRDNVIACYKDLGRSIDYLETRPDIDSTKLAYEGASWGAAMGAIFPAMEDRFKALVLLDPGFYMEKRFSAADQINFAPRVKAPVLMLNGRFDFLFPTGSSQEYMFKLLGTPPEHKRRVLYDTSHDDLPRAEVIKEAVNWLDRYLGRAK